MPSRRRARQEALQILFSWDLRRQPLDEAIAAYYDSLTMEELSGSGGAGAAQQPARDPFVELLVRGAVEHLAEIDQKITQHAEHWRIERMPTVDRNILRLAIFEMTQTETPAPVAIDEALELAHRFSEEKSVQFINGVLDAVHRERGG
ncbi:MAG: transcription antitermination factor NusB [Bryobacteraceae bacterium]